MEKMYVVYECAYGHNRVEQLEFDRDTAIKLAYGINKNLKRETWVAEINIGEPYCCDEIAIDNTIIAFFR